VLNLCVFPAADFLDGYQTGPNYAFHTRGFSSVDEQLPLRYFLSL
jgi:hypothetical protein